MAARSPDFCIIGSMKAGTTSLYRWLDAHPGCSLPERKEPEFLLSDDDPRPRYRELFSAVDPGLVTGEASVAYGHPDRVGAMAERARRWFPDLAMVYVVRDPVDRLRSHYRHQRLRGRERRPLAEAVSAPGNDYVALSRYADVIDAVEGSGMGDRLLVVAFEDLTTTSDESAWTAVLDHVGLAAAPRPTEVHNVSDERVAYRPVLRFVHDHGGRRILSRLPASVRRWGRWAVDDSDETRRRIDEQSSAPLPPAVLDTLSAQTERMARRNRA